MEKMRLGVCARPEQIDAAADAGFDYLEMDINAILRLGSNEYHAMTAAMKKRGIYAEIVSGILPDETEIIGEHVSAKLIHAALERSFAAARLLGANMMVFDSARAGRIPPNFDPAIAWRQFGNFIRMLQSYAADNDMRVALMPMRRSAADLMNHTTEATLISAMLRLDRIGVAADSYNMAMEAEPLSALRRCGSLLWHVRTSNVLGDRMPRIGDGENYAALMQALREINYSGRITCKGSYCDFSADAKEALKCMRQVSQ